jgi:large subunit ribosomal protein L4
MYKARYYKADGKKGKARALPDSLFDGVVNEGVMHQAVTTYLANQRQGTAAAKGRSDVRGGGRKPWRQKGTGRARAGTIRSPIWVGGGVAFPPIPHSWRKRLPKKVKALARRSALNDRAENDRVVLADLPVMESPKTRDLVSFLGSIAPEGKVLVLTDGTNENLYLSARNLSNVSVVEFGGESVYDVLWAYTVVIERSALDEKPKAKAKVKAETAAEAAPEAEAEVEPAAEAEEEAEEEAPEADEEEAPEAEAEEAAEAEADEAPEAEAVEAPEAEAEVEPAAEAEEEAEEEAPEADAEEAPEVDTEEDDDA